MKTCANHFLINDNVLRNCGCKKGLEKPVSDCDPLPNLKHNSLIEDIMDASSLKSAHQIKTFIASTANMQIGKVNLYPIVLITSIDNSFTRTEENYDFQPSSGCGTDLFASREVK